MEAFAFYFFGAITCALFLVVVNTNNLLYALSALAGGMISISAYFFLLGAEFLGIAQIIVYTGAVVVVYAFSLMFFDTNKPLREKINAPSILLGTSATIFVLLLFALLLAPIVVWELPNPFDHSLLIAAQNLAGGESPQIGDAHDMQMVGYRLFSQYLIAFELAAMLLLVAMISGVVLASKPPKDEGNAQ